MKLASCIADNIEQVAIVENDRLLPASRASGWPSGCISMIDVIAGGIPVQRALSALALGASSESWMDLKDVRLLCPIPRPIRNVMCLGWNYADHSKESAATTGREVKLPKFPVVFTKTPESMTGPYDELPLDEEVTQELDWEVELAVIIGKPGRRIPESCALDHVFGYSVLNDITARDLQRRHKQFFLGKSLDACTPMGPWITTADEISDPQSLDLSCSVNGEIKQSSNTEHQIFGVARTISILSQGMTLKPGDIIASGTPSGVGFARQPPEFLKPGDVVETVVQGLGVLRNRIGSC